MSRPHSGEPEATVTRKYGLRKAALSSGGKRRAARRAGTSAKSRRDGETPGRRRRTRLSSPGSAFSELTNPTWRIGHLRSMSRQAPPPIGSARTGDANARRRDDVHQPRPCRKRPDSQARFAPAWCAVDPTICAGGSYRILLANSITWIDGRLPKRALSAVRAT